MDLREQITKRSIKKRKKFILAEEKIDGDKTLELGCSAAGLSKMLRRGYWVGYDLDEDVVREYSQYLKVPAVVGREKLPFKDESFSSVLMFDFLEHVDEDSLLLRETKRVLKRGGRVIITTPRAGRLFIIKFRNFIGLRKEAYGHKREGYTPDELITMVKKEGFKIKEISLYSGFFVEFLEAIQNAIYFRISRNKKDRRSGNISPVQEEEFKKLKKLLLFQKIAFPFFLLADFIDRIFKTKRHVIFLTGEKE